jgi:transposase
MGPLEAAVGVADAAPIRLPPKAASGKLQIVFGLSCARDGCPVAIEVFDGNVADPATLANQVKKLKERFALERVVLVPAELR